MFVLGLTDPRSHMRFSVFPLSSFRMLFLLRAKGPGEHKQCIVYTNGELDVFWICTTTLIIFDLPTFIPKSFGTNSPVLRHFADQHDKYPIMHSKAMKPPMPYAVHYS